MFALRILFCFVVFGLACGLHFVVLFCWVDVSVFVVAICFLSCSRSVVRCFVLFSFVLLLCCFVYVRASYFVLLRCFWFGLRFAFRCFALFSFDCVALLCCFRLCCCVSSLVCLVWFACCMSLFCFV